MILLIFALVLLVIASWIYFFRDVKTTNLPGPKPYPIIGNGNLFLSDSNKFLITLSDLGEKYNDAFRMYMMMTDLFIVLSHPKHIEQLMTSSETITKGKAYNYMRPWLGDGLLTSTGAKWRSHRKFLTPAFHYNSLQNFLPVFLKNSNILCDNLKQHADGSSVELFPIIAMAALDNITETIMGVSLHAQKEADSIYVKNVHVVSEIVSMRMRDVFMGNDLYFSMTSYKSQLDKAIKYLHNHTNEVIEARRKELNKNSTQIPTERSESGMRNKHAFLDLLLLAEVDGKRISDECVRDEVVTFMFEGHDTTASGTAYCLYCIAKHPEVQRRILEEQVSVLGGDLTRDPTFSELQEMKYLDCVIKESLRIFPSIPLMLRRITKDMEIGGIRYPKDTTVMINVFRMHRNPDVFEDPLEFRPERFETTSTKNAFSWLAFSAGPRNCIGDKPTSRAVRTDLPPVGVMKMHTFLPPVGRKVFCLSTRHPQELQEMLTVGCPSDHTRDWWCELQEMKYLDCVIKESLRIFPSIPLMLRRITKDMEIGGIRYPKDTTVMINVFRMHRNPDVFEDPLEFRPERFETTSTKNAFSWLAFSAGPRNCIGQKFAMLEMKAMLAAIVKRFQLAPSGAAPEPCGDLILRSLNGVHIKLAPRI